MPLQVGESDGWDLVLEIDNRCKQHQKTSVTNYDSVQHMVRTEINIDIHIVALPNSGRYLQEMIYQYDCKNTRLVSLLYIVKKKIE